VPGSHICCDIYASDVGDDSIATPSQNRDEEAHGCDSCGSSSMGIIVSPDSNGD
jgi:hypothetical protein